VAIFGGDCDPKSKTGSFDGLATSKCSDFWRAIYLSLLDYSLSSIMMLILARLIKVTASKKFSYEGSLAINANEERCKL